MGGGVCEQFSPGGGEGSVEAIRVGHVWEEGRGDLGGLAMTVPSSGALRLVVFVIGVGVSLVALSWVVPLVPLRVRLIFRVPFQKGLTALKGGALREVTLGELPIAVVLGEGCSLSMMCNGEVATSDSSCGLRLLCLIGFHFLFLKCSYCGLLCRDYLRRRSCSCSRKGLLSMFFRFGGCRRLLFFGRSIR